MTVRQSDIARELGITQVAVSKALRGAADISEKMRQEVLAAADKLGYRKNMIAHSLAEGRTKIIGYLVPGSSGHFFSHILSSIQTYLQAEGYQLLIKTHDVSSELDDNDVELFMNYHVDGIISFPKSAVPWNESIYKKILKQNIPIVLLNQDVDLPGAVCVFSDNNRGAIECVNHLVKNGHREIGIILPDHMYDTTVQNRYQGYIDGLEQNNIRANNDYVVRYNVMPALERSFVGFFKNNPQITAVLCYNDHVAMKLYDFAKEMNFKIPDDLTVIGFGNDIAYPEHLAVPLSTVSQCGIEMGRTAVELLMKKINGERVPARNVIPTEFISRQSVKNINKKGDVK